MACTGDLEPPILRSLAFHCLPRVCFQTLTPPPPDTQDTPGHHLASPSHLCPPDPGSKLTLALDCILKDCASALGWSSRLWEGETPNLTSPHPALARACGIGPVTGIHQTQIRMWAPVSFCPLLANIPEPRVIPQLARCLGETELGWGGVSESSLPLFNLPVSGLFISAARSRHPPGMSHKIQIV